MKHQMEQKERKKAKSAINHKIKDEQVKQYCKRDKQRFLDNIAGEAETAAQTGDSKTLYRLVKELSSPEWKTGLPIKDDMGKKLSTHEVQAWQWKHHFETVLICPEPAVHDFKT